MRRNELKVCVCVCVCVLGGGGGVNIRVSKMAPLYRVYKKR